MTMTTDPQLVRSVVEEVLQHLAPAGASLFPLASATAMPSNGSSASGCYANVDQAVDAATRAQAQLAQAGLEVRQGICDLLRTMAVDNAEPWGRFEMDETKIGRVDHKVVKLQMLANIPGVEFLKSVAHSGDQGISIDEAAPWGVIGVITPVTHSIPTMTANAIAMIAAGNALVVNAHPSGAKSAVMAAEAFNKAIKAEFNIDPLICAMDPPTLRTAEEIFRHERIALLVTTGGPAVARAAMKQTKRAIVAGPGNPPVVVDETADFDNAARSIISGGAFDNNLLCIGEKEVFVVDSVFDAMMDAMSRAGAHRLDAGQISRLTEAAFEWKNDHHAVRKAMVGSDPQVLGQAAGANVAPGVELLYGETAEDNPFVPVEQMMPFLPFVRVRNFEEALSLAIKHEHGFGHTSIIHSNNLDHITRMGQAMNTTIFVANGACTAALGSGGEGYASYSIATPTGEGITTPLTFTRFRRMCMSHSLRIV